MEPDAVQRENKPLECRLILRRRSKLICCGVVGRSACGFIDIPGSYGLTTLASLLAVRQPGEDVPCIDGGFPCSHKSVDSVTTRTKCFCVGFQDPLAQEGLYPG